FLASAIVGHLRLEARRRGRDACRFEPTRGGRRANPTKRVARSRRHGARTKPVARGRGTTGRSERAVPLPVKISKPRVHSECTVAPCRHPAAKFLPKRRGIGLPTD